MERSRAEGNPIPCLDDIRREQIEAMRQNEAWVEKQMANYKPADHVDSVWFNAARQAARNAKEAELYPRLTEDGEYRYAVQQGLRAAHHTREDAAATLLLMRPVLYALRTVTRLLWFVIALLMAIAWKLWA